MSEPIKFSPNVPVVLSLLDPNGEYDFGVHQGNYQTTGGQSFTLPKPAVVKLLELEPLPGEEIQITKKWAGTPGSQFEWVICLTPRSERLRAIAECKHCDGTGHYGEGKCPACSKAPIPEPQEPAGLVSALQASIEQAEARKRPVALSAAKKQPKAEPQPRLFDQKGTGTDGPAPAPAVKQQPVAASLPAKTRYPDMLRHIVKTVKWALAVENLQLGDGPTQDLISTVYIDAAKRSGVEYDFTREVE